jgi:hypothetical protein
MAQFVSRAKQASQQQGSPPTETTLRSLAPVAPVLQLQQTIGNQNVSSLLESQTIQTKRQPHSAVRGAELLGGAPLPLEFQTRLEVLLGAPLNSVRIHSDYRAAQLARLFGARAFTVGEHVWLGERADPSDAKLLGHELVHVIQQRRGLAAGSTIGPSGRSGMLEAEARGAGEAVATGRSAGDIQGAAPISIQRDEEVGALSQTLNVQVVPAADGVELTVSGETVAIVQGTDATPETVQVRVIRTQHGESGLGSTTLRIQVAHPQGTESHPNIDLLTSWSQSGVDVHFEAHTYQAPVIIDLERGSEGISLTPPPSTRAEVPRFPVTPRRPPRRRPQPISSHRPSERPAVRNLQEFENIVSERTPPVPPPGSDPDVQQVLRHLWEGRWDTDTLAAGLTEAQTGTLSLDDRIALIRHIARGFVVANEDEQTIIRLLRTTPRHELRALMDALNANNGELLRDLESAIDFDEYKEYHILLMNLRLASRQPAELLQEMQNAPTITWSDPGLLRAYYTYRSYIEDAELTDEGRVRITMWHNIAIMGIRQEPFELDPMQLVRVNFPIGEEQFGAALGQTMFMPAIDLLSLHRKQFKGELQTVGDVAAIAAGGVGIVGAATRLGRIVAVAETAFGLADLAIRDYRSTIAQTEAGRSFLQAWSVVSVLVGVYGIGRAVMGAPQAFRALRDTFRQFRGVQHGLSPQELAEVEREINRLTDSADEALAASRPPGLGGTSAAGGGGQLPSQRPPSLREPPGPGVPGVPGGGLPQQPARLRGATAEGAGSEFRHEIFPQQSRPPEVSHVRRPRRPVPQPEPPPPATRRASPPRERDIQAEVEAEFRSQQEGAIPERDPGIGDVREQLHPRLSAQAAPSEHLARALASAGDPRPAVGYHPHHIIPTGLYRSPYVAPGLADEVLLLQQRLNEALAEAGRRSDLNTALNGVWLPGNRRVANVTGSNLHLSDIHARNNAYIAAISRRLRSRHGADFLRELEAIKREMRSGRFRF